MIGKMVLVKNDKNPGLAHLQPMHDEKPASLYTFCGLTPAKDQAAELAARANVDLVTCPLCAAYQEGDTDTRPLARTDEDREAEGRSE